jgi:hypothetical protein
MDDQTSDERRNVLDSADNRHAVDASTALDGVIVNKADWPILLASIAEHVSHEQLARMACTDDQDPPG